MVRSKPRQILHIIGAYTMSCKQGSKRGAYIGPRENHYCALGYARANAQPKARQPTRPKGHFIDTFSFFSSFSILSYKEARAAGFVLFCCLGRGLESTMYREMARHSARFYALRAASGADGSRPIPTLLPGKGLFSINCGTHICRPLQPHGYYDIPGKPHGTVKTVPYKPTKRLRLSR